MMFLSIILNAILVTTVFGLIIRSDIDSIDGRRCTKRKPVAASQFPVGTIQCLSIVLSSANLSPLDVQEGAQQGVILRSSFTHR